MSCCCNKVYRLCDQAVCDPNGLMLPVPIPADGLYTLELNFLGDTIRKEAMLSSGDNATFDMDGLNEKYTYTGRVVDATGETLTFTVDEIEYDCIEFTTKRTLNGQPADLSASSS